MRALTLALVALALAGCGHVVTTGWVTSTRKDPAHTEMYYRQQWAGETCTPTGTGTSATRVCTPIYIQIPYWVDVPDRCYETLQDEEGASEYGVGCGQEHRVGEG